MRRKILVPGIVVTAMVLVGLGVVSYLRDADSGPNADKNPAIEQVNSQSDQSTLVQTPTSSQAARLTYLIEEEKLAHDVYTKLYERWGSAVFGNIIDSESSHESRVLALLQSKNIADPRSNEIGVFADQNLQKLYDQLIAQGMRSIEEAYRVGVTIEETDIADLTSDLGITDDPSEIAVLEALRQGSENHLRAFNRQLSRIQS